MRQPKLSPLCRTLAPNAPAAPNPAAEPCEPTAQQPHLGRAQPHQPPLRAAGPAGCILYTPHALHCTLCSLQQLMLPHSTSMQYTAASASRDRPHSSSSRLPEARARKPQLTGSRPHCCAALRATPTPMAPVVGLDPQMQRSAWQRTHHTPRCSPCHSFSISRTATLLSAPTAKSPGTSQSQSLSPNTSQRRRPGFTPGGRLRSNFDQV
jgi:hypothetical protein